MNSIKTKYNNKTLLIYCRSYWFYNGVKKEEVLDFDKQLHDNLQLFVDDSISKEYSLLIENTIKEEGDQLTRVKKYTDTILNHRLGGIYEKYSKQGRLVYNGITGVNYFTFGFTIEEDAAYYHYFKDFKHNVYEDDGKWYCLEELKDSKMLKIFKYMFTDINKMLNFMYLNYIKYNKIRAEQKKIDD